MTQSLLVIALLIAASAFFSMAEISLAAARRLRLRQMADEGDPRADLVLRIQEQPGDYFTVVQVGQNAIAILGGIVGEGTFSAGFAFEETPDQQTTIEAVRAEAAQEALAAARASIAEFGFTPEDLFGKPRQQKGSRRKRKHGTLPTRRTRVIINEAIELAKGFGGTDGHKYVNGVLDKLAAKLRPVEVQAKRAARKS